MSGVKKRVLACGLLPKIEHVVVLMLENRSFDCMLGYLYPKPRNRLQHSIRNPLWALPGTAARGTPS